MSERAAGYSERYCAFIDILGFRGLIGELNDGNVTVDEIYRVLTAVQSPQKTIRAEAELRHQSISDAITLSAAPNAAGLDAICSAAGELSRRLLRSGYFTRGGLTKGRLYQDQNTVFGPGLVEAYRLENEVAKFPRILVPRSVTSDARLYAQQGTHWERAFKGTFVRAADGPSFLHILRDQSLHLAEVAGRSPKPSIKNDAVLKILAPMRTAIQKRFDEASDVPEHFQKVAWFAAYWNEHIGMYKIEGLEEVTAGPW